MRKQTPGWYYMQIMQITLTTEFWLQALIPSYLYYVSPWKLNWCKDLFSDWCENFRKNYWYQSCRRKLCDVSECLQCYSWIVFRIYHWFPQLCWMWGKAKPLKLMTKRFRYIKAFSMFGKEITLADSLVSKLEMFVCHMYGWKENGVDNVRYHLTPRVVEKSPVIHYSLLMTLYTSQVQTTRLTFAGKVWWHNRNSLTLLSWLDVQWQRKLFDP